MDCSPKNRTGAASGTEVKRATMHWSMHSEGESKREKKKQAFPWIDYKKAFEMVTQKWMIFTLKMYQISGNVTKLLKNTKEKGRVKLKKIGKSSLRSKSSEVSSKELRYRHYYLESSSSSSSCRAASTDIPDPLSPRFPIIHRLRQVFRVTSRIIT